MFLKHGWLLALFGMLFLTTPPVLAQALTVACTNPVGPNVLSGYSTACVASGGAGPYTWSISGGQLPAGVNGLIRFRYAPRDQDATVPLETRKAAAYLVLFDNCHSTTRAASSPASHSRI